MDVAEFQTRLEELCRIAKNSENQLTQKQLREAFGELSLEREQLLKILKYLKMQGIEIEGAAEPGKAAPPADTKSVKADGNAFAQTAGSASDKSGNTVSETKQSDEGTKTPLTLEEKDYLREYLADISAKDSNNVKTDDSLPSLFKRLSQGNDLAMAQLTQRYLPVAAEMAAEMNCAEIALPDLIQEANVGLLTALSEPEPTLKNDLWLRSKIRRSIAEAIDEQSQQKFRDDCLVARVEKLESAVRDLTDDDGENRFSVDELAVILDMSTEEIRDILKLTGDDK